MHHAHAVDDAVDLQSSEHPRWRALTLGTLSVEEEATLRRAAPDLYERCRPLDADRMVARVEGALAVRRRSVSPLNASAKPRRAPPVWMPGAVYGCALTLAIVIGMVPVRSSLRKDPWRYEVSPPRGDAPGVPILSAPDSRLDMTLSPVGRVRGPMAFRGAALIHPETGRAHPWHIDLEPTRDNEIFLSGTRATLFPGVASGEWEMYLAVGRPGPRLTEPELRRLVGQGPRDGTQVLRVPVVLRGPCAGTFAHPCA